MSQSLGDKVGAGPEPRHRAFCVALLGGHRQIFSPEGPLQRTPVGGVRTVQPCYWRPGGSSAPGSGREPSCLQ